MRIDDVSLTLFAWDGIPATSYGRHTGRFEGGSELGLLTVRTDGGSRAMRSSARPAGERPWMPPP